MFTSKYFKASVLAVALFTCAPYAAASATFTTIDYPGAVHTYALGNNPAGDVVGSYTNASGRHGFLLSNGDFTSFDYPGAVWTEAYGINPRGDIVGQYRYPMGTSWVLRGFLLRRGEFYPIDIPGHQNTMPYKISPNGTIVGCVHGAAMYGFTRTAKGDVDLTHLDSMNLGVNPAADVVGYYYGNPLLQPSDHVEWSYVIRNGAMSWFQYPDAYATFATDISPNGTIIGRYRMSPTLPVYGFILSNGQFESFNVPGASHMFPYGINAKGDIVGYYWASGVYHGFLRQ